MKRILFKDIAQGVSDVDEKNMIFSGYAGSFGNIDSYGDTVDKGAYDKTLELWGPKALDRIRAFRNHRSDLVFGRPLELFTDDFGLKHVTKVSATANGIDTFILIKDGVIKEHSIGYEAIRTEPDENNEGVNKLLEIKLWEYSILPHGADIYTPVIEVKDALAARATLKESYERLMRTLNNSPWQGENIPHLLKYELRTWQPIIEKLGEYDEHSKRKQYANGVQDDAAVEAEAAQLESVKAQLKGLLKASEDARTNELKGGLDILLKEIQHNG